MLDRLWVDQTLGVREHHAAHVQLSSVNGEDGAGDPRGRGGEEEHGRVGNVGCTISYCCVGLQVARLTSISHPGEGDLRLGLEPLRGKLIHAHGPGDGSSISVMK